MNQYLAIDTQKLTSFLTKTIQNVDNPEEFQRHINQEIQKVMKSQQIRLKQMRSKMKTKKLAQEAAAKQEQLKTKLESKLKTGAQRKIKTLQNRVQSLADLRIRKERCIAAQREIKRRQSLSNSLKLIESLERKSLKTIGNIDNKSGCFLNLKTSQVHQIRSKQTLGDFQKQTVPYNVQPKSAYEPNSRHKITDLYAKRARHVKQQLQRKHEQHLNQHRRQLKVDSARKRKRKLILERLQKIRNIELIQHKLKQSRQAIPYSQFNQKISAQRTTIKSSQSKHSHNYKQQIRQQIACFIKNGGVSLIF